MENNIFFCFQALISTRLWESLRFVLLVGFCTKRRPWPNSLKTTNIIVPRFCFGRESCSCCLRRISRRLWRGSSFWTFGGVLYKTKTLAKFVENRKISSFPASASGLNHVWSIFKRFQDDFEGIFVFGSSVFVLYPPITKLQNGGLCTFVGFLIKFLSFSENKLLRIAR